MDYNSPVFLKYIPHGINPKHFYKVTSTEGKARVAELRKQMFAGEDVDFVVLYNNRNIRRKMTGDVILAYQLFLKELPMEKQEKCRLVLHTQPVDENGTDLVALIRDLAPEIKVVFSADRVSVDVMNDIYNLSDVVINLASNEGFGLGTAEALMAEKMIIVNVTGGLQDQCGFVDDNGLYLDPDVHFHAEWGSNHDGRYTVHGNWCVPVFPTSRALIGSVPTPYIFDDRCRWEDAAVALRTVYDLPKEERERRGENARHFAMTQALNSPEMCKRFIDGIDAVFAQWKPRARFSLIKA